MVNLAVPEETGAGYFRWPRDDSWGSLVIRRISLGNNRCGNLLQAKHFQYKEQTVRIEQELAKMMKLHRI